MPDSRPKTEPDEITGLKSLGKRITRRTFDLTGFAIVAIGLITVTVRLAGWWQAGDDVVATTAVTSQAQAPWGLGAEGALLSFGDADWSARHLTLMGTAEEVRERLVAECSNRLSDGINLAALKEQGAEEADLVSRLTALTPVDENGDWKVYALEAPLLAVFGVATDDASDSQQANSRIVIWGLALPAGMALLEPAAGESTENQQPLWSAWMIDPAGGASSSEVLGPVVPCPEGANRVLSIRDPHAGGIHTFRGPRSLSQWQQFFSNWLNELGADADWNGESGRVQTSAMIEHDGRSWRCDILLTDVDSAGEIECLVNLVEAAVEPRETE